MSRLFNGLGRAANIAFGARVGWERGGVAQADLRGVFRRDPLEIEGGEGVGVVVLASTIEVPKTVILQEGDKVFPSLAPGEAFRVVNSHPSSSPARDAFVLYELELVE